MEGQHKDPQGTGSEDRLCGPAHLLCQTLLCPSNLQIHLCVSCISGTLALHPASALCQAFCGYPWALSHPSVKPTLARAVPVHLEVYLLQRWLPVSSVPCPFLPLSSWPLKTGTYVPALLMRSILFLSHNLWAAWPCVVPLGLFPASWLSVLSVVLAWFSLFPQDV